MVFWLTQNVGVNVIIGDYTIFSSVWRAAFSLMLKMSIIFSRTYTSTLKKALSKYWYSNIYKIFLREHLYIAHVLFILMFANVRQFYELYVSTVYRLITINNTCVIYESIAI